MEPKRPRFSSYKPLIGSALGAGIAYLFSNYIGTEAALIMVGLLAGHALGSADMGGDAHDYVVDLLEEEGLFDRLDERRRREWDDE